MTNQHWHMCIYCHRLWDHPGSQDECLLAENAVCQSCLEEEIHAAIQRQYDIHLQQSNAAYQQDLQNALRGGLFHR